MAGIVLIEPTELYNLLNQASVYSNLSDATYMILLDARNKEAYNESHVVTSKRIKMDEDGNFLVPYDSELECKEHVIVYDGNTNSIASDSTALNCAQLLSDKGSRNPVKIVNGGYERFSALYPFLRTQKILFMPRELDEYKPYPLEVLPGCLYIGTEKQALSPYIQKDLKLKAYINCNIEENKMFPVGNQLFPASVTDTNDADISVFFEGSNAFIESHKEEGRNVLIYSTRGDSRCVTMAMAFLMYHCHLTFADSWKHMQKCCHLMRPNRNFVQQLSHFEETLFEERITDVSDPLY